MALRLRWRRQTRQQPGRATALVNPPTVYRGPLPASPLDTLTTWVGGFSEDSRSSRRTRFSRCNRESSSVRRRSIRLATGLERRLGPTTGGQRSRSVPDRGTPHPRIWRWSAAGRPFVLWTQGYWSVFDTRSSSTLSTGSARLHPEGPPTGRSRRTSFRQEQHPFSGLAFTPLGVFATATRRRTAESSFQWRARGRRPGPE